MTTWTAQAQLLTGDLPEWGVNAARLNAAAWSAGLMPEATRGLIGAAAALTGNRAGEALWARTEPCADAPAMLMAAAELEAGAAELLKRAQDMTGSCRDAYDTACVEYQAAEADANSEDPAARASGTERMEQARRVIADTDAALETLADALARLGHARTCLARVPDDYAETYHVPITLVRRGLKLPYAGSYLGDGIPACHP